MPVFEVPSIVLRALLVINSLIAFAYMALKERRPLERLVVGICAAVTIYMAAFTVWNI